MVTWAWLTKMRAMIADSSIRGSSRPGVRLPVDDCRTPAPWHALAAENAISSAVTAIFPDAEFGD